MPNARIVFKRDNSFLHIDGIEGQSFSTDQDGRFETTKMPVGKYKMLVYPSRSRADDQKEFEIETDRPEQVFRLSAESRSKASGR